MCGIAGYIGTRHIGDRHVEDCRARLHHRGPDDSGVYRHERHGKHVVLVHTRLAIIDLNPRAAQPMRYGDHVLAYNGELYNYLELRKELEHDGEVFQTGGDSEVLLRTLVGRGIQGLEQCEGMWAFALYDENRGELLLSRDRFGEKPLYYHKTTDGIYFASEIKALFALLGRRLEVDKSQVRRFLVNGYKSLHKGTATFFKDLCEVPSGCNLTIDGHGESRLGRYWEYSTDHMQDIGYDEAVLMARERLLQAVGLRLRADVPLAFCMSGGVDSNTIIAIAKRIFDYDVHGFTVVNTDRRYDEWDNVRLVIEELGIKHSAIAVERGGFLENLRSLVVSHDAPVSTISYYAHWLLMQSIAKHGYTVSLSGTAADEIFTGYYDHYTMYLQALHGKDGFDEALRSWRKHVRPVVRNPLLQDPYAFVEDPCRREHVFDCSGRFADFMTESFSEPFGEEALHEELLRNRMLNEIFYEVVPVALHEDDHNAMFFSIENRSPFLDRQLFEFMLSVPTCHLMRDGYNKKILRDAMRGIVPEPILTCREKVGFNAPIFDFLDNRARETREELLAESPIFEIVRRDAIEELLNIDSLSNAESKFLFSFITSKFFLEEFY